MALIALRGSQAGKLTIEPQHDSFMLPDPSMKARTTPIAEADMTVINHAVQILFQGGLFPLMCAEENVEQTFPEDLYKNTEGEDVYVVALEAMRYVEQLYNNSLTSVTWNKTKLNMFQNVIYRQVQNLELCVSMIPLV
ncbi:interferon a3-like [Salmo trutta]|uniref:interferon a3-like n=1 Tax=Salmo trutta TaxID=8032 RepID=UPI00113255C9|nr:interferon a3-like [Salmo trutta]